MQKLFSHFFNKKYWPISDINIVNFNERRRQFSTTGSRSSKITYEMGSTLNRKNSLLRTKILSITSVTIEKRGKYNNTCLHPGPSCSKLTISLVNVVVVALLFYVHGKHLRSCRDGMSYRIVKILNINISNMPIFFVEKM